MQGTNKSVAESSQLLIKNLQSIVRLVLWCIKLTMMYRISEDQLCINTTNLLRYTVVLIPSLSHLHSPTHDSPLSSFIVHIAQKTQMLRQVLPL